MLLENECNSNDLQQTIETFCVQLKHNWSGIINSWVCPALRFPCIKCAYEVDTEIYNKKSYNMSIRFKPITSLTFETKYIVVYNIKQ